MGTIAPADAGFEPGPAVTFVEASGGVGEAVFDIGQATGEIVVEDPAALDRESSVSLFYEITVSNGTETALVSVEVSLVGVNDNAPSFSYSGPLTLEEPSGEPDPQLPDADFDVTLTVNADMPVYPFRDTMRGVGTNNWNWLWSGLWDRGGGADKRNAIIDATSYIEPGIIRFAGGLWVNSVGWDRYGVTSGDDESWTYIDPDTGESYGYNHVYKKGMVDSFADFSAQLNAKAMIQVNICDNNPKMWQDLVRYANIERGYGFEYWELGNEQTLESCGLDASAYAERYAQYQAALKAIDPGIKVLGPIAHQPYYSSWEDALVDEVGADLDVLAWHWYQLTEWNSDPTLFAFQGGSVDALLAWGGNVGTVAQTGFGEPGDPNSIPDGRLDRWIYRRGIAEQKMAYINETYRPSDPSLETALTEFGVNASFHTHPINGNHLAAVWLADVLGRWAYNGLDIATYYSLEDGSTSGGNSRGLIGIEGGSALDIRPIYYTEWLYAQRFGDLLVESSTSDPENKVVVWASADSEDPGKLKLMLINLTDKPSDTLIQTNGFYSETGYAYVMESEDPVGAGNELSASDPSSFIDHSTTINGVTIPDYVIGDPSVFRNAIESITPTHVDTSAEFIYTIPAYSVVALELESANAGPAVGTVVAADSDIGPSDTLTFSEVAGGQGESIFDIAEATGLITVEDLAAIDWESAGALHYDIQVSDGVNSTATTVVVNLTGINDNPPGFTFTGPFTIEENSAAGAPIGMLTAQDADVGPAGSLVFSEVPGSAGEQVFNIDPASGEISVEDSSALDRETVDSFLYEVQVSDGSNVAFAAVTIGIGGLSDNQPIANAQQVTVSQGGSVTITLTGDDADIDPVEQLSFSIVNSPSDGTLSGISSTGLFTAEVTYTPSAQFSGADSFEFVANDGQEDSVAALVTIIVEPQPSTGGGPGAGGSGGAPASPSIVPPSSPPPAAPSAPTSTTATPGDSSVTISWEPPVSDGGATVTGYRVLNLNSADSRILSADTTSFFVSGLVNGTAYTFQLQVINIAGASASVIVGPVTPFGPPGIPTNIEAEPTETGSVFVSWSAPESDEGASITGYIVSLADGPDLLTVNADEPLTTEISDLARGQSYSFVVRAVNEAGEGNPSSPSALVFVPSPPEEPANGHSADAIFVVQEPDTTTALQEAVMNKLGGDLLVSESPIVFVSRNGQQSILIELEAPVGQITELNQFSVISDQLTIEAGSRSNVTFNIAIGTDISVTGAAQLVMAPEGIRLDIIESYLIYSPESLPETGPIESVQFEVALNRFSADAALVAEFLQAVPDEIADRLSQLSVDDSALIAGDLLAEVAGVIAVSKNNILDTDLADTTVSMAVSASWYEQQVARDHKIAFLKLADDGKVFMEPAACENEQDHYVCRADFTGAAGGFSTFVLSGVSSQDEPAMATVTATAVPSATATPSLIATFEIETVDSTPQPFTPSVVPSSTPVLLAGDVSAISVAPDGGGISVWGWVAIAALGLVGCSIFGLLIARIRT